MLLSDQNILSLNSQLVTIFCFAEMIMLVTLKFNFVIWSTLYMFVVVHNHHLRFNSRMQKHVIPPPN